ncbi:MAG: 2-iminoacetate synthase ThiH [Thermoanaerobacteraceae bacterium]|jgi:2-iminoacetate synthase|nr:2-iminoacetate synthase ThiH [Thermoanaerobacteraceae bacterium]
MTFYDEYIRYRNFNFEGFFNSISDYDIEKVISKDKLNIYDFLALLSPNAEKYLEIMAQKAHRVTIQNFGRVILLYIPMYLANYCINKCAYCGYNADNKIKRNIMSIEDVRHEAELISQKGFRHILILTGESRAKTPVSYIKTCAAVLKEYFSSICIEIYPLKEKEYEELVHAGVDSITIYQETYDEKTYDEVHLSGPKKNYKYRLETPDRACRAGIKNVNIGALLGLNDWRKDVFYTALHAKYLQDKYGDVDVGVSVPRIKPHIGAFQPKSNVSDKNLVQIILSFRIFMPRLGISLSTRENADLRNNLIPLGITKFSAESSTKVGGYLEEKEYEDSGQFEVSDNRSLEEIVEMIRSSGYQPIFKDWENVI